MGVARAGTNASAQNGRFAFVAAPGCERVLHKVDAVSRRPVLQHRGSERPSWPGRVIHGRASLGHATRRLAVPLLDSCVPEH